MTWVVLLRLGLRMWTSHPLFLAKVEEWWNGAKVEGWTNFCFMRKLKAMKEKLKMWNVEVFGDIRVRKR